MHLDIKLLGRFAVAVDGVDIDPATFTRESAAAVVKLLAITPRHRMRREQVVDIFWPEAERDAGGANLRKAVHFARKALGDAALIETSGDSIAFGRGVEVTVDAQQFETAGRAALRGADPGACASAADLCAGALLPDDLYFGWLDGPRATVAQLRLDLLRTAKLWQRLIEVDPSDEPAHLELMRAALAEGNRGEAIRLFNQLRSALQVELGLGPSEAAVELYEAALAMPRVDPVSQRDRVRASLAWGLLHFHSGDFDKATTIAEETRRLALSANLVREVGEASALFGLCAHMQGRWKEVFKAEFIEWARQQPDKVSQIIDGHLCLAEFCLCNAKGHHEIGSSARELLSVAEGAGSFAGRGLAMLILGEAALFSGHLGEAERYLREADSLLETASAASGRAIALERLAEVALAKGQKWQARRLIQRAVAVAERSWLSPHLAIRLQGLKVRAASNRDDAMLAIHEGDRLLADQRHGCQPCSMGFRIAAAIAMAAMTDLPQVDRRLEEAERIADMWHGGPWVAAIWEARGVQRRAERNSARAALAFEEAASRYAALGRPADEARCRAELSTG